METRLHLDGNTQARVTRRAVRLGLHTILIVGAVIAALPFLWMLLTSLKSYQEFIIGQLVPDTLRFGNYIEAWQMAPFGRYFLNSIFISTTTVTAVLVTSTLAAYAFARIDFYGRDVLFMVFLATLMVPFEVTMIPNFILIRDLGWYDTYWAMIVPFSASVFGVFLLRQFFATIPSDYYDAAVLDGCGHLRFLWEIVLPLSRPALITVGLFTFLGSWNALLWPLIVTRTQEIRPIMLGLAEFISEAGTQTQLLMAAATLTILPVVIFYFFAQREFIEGLASGGLKG
jgi:ABC-type glycerol-3-phosphate transport system permease component